jgi:Tol biopolymer transport system component
MRRKAPIALVLVSAIGLGLAASHGALAAVGTTQISVTAGGQDVAGESTNSAVSRNGRYVAFASEAADLVQGDHTSSWPDIFLRDLATGTTSRVSVATDGGDPNGGSYYPVISANGRYVAFWSSASNLVPGDGNGVMDVFVRDLVAGTTVRASVDAAGGDANGHSSGSSISDDGRYVAFVSIASDLVAGDADGFVDVFVRDLWAKTTVRASSDMQGGDPNGYNGSSAISANGRYVAFRSYASDLVPNDGNGKDDVFVRNLQTGITVRASVDTDGGDPDKSSGNPWMSADGRYVAFRSQASDLVPGDTNGHDDIFVRDLVAGTTVRASVDTDGGNPNSGSFDPAISANGRYVAFWSYASDLVAGDGNGMFDVFVRDLSAGTTVRASADTGGGDPDGQSKSPSISPDGRYVSFCSSATDLVGGSGDAGLDVFLARW